MNFFRFLLLIIALFLSIVQDGFFSRWIYLLIVLVYAFVLYLFRKIESPIIYLDFIFINAMVYNRDLAHPITFFFVLMPLINAINCTCKLGAYFLLLLLTACTILLNYDDSSCLFTAPILALMGMFLLASVEYERWKLDRKLTSKIDNFFLSSAKLKSHQIYPGIIDELNRYAHFSSNHGIQQIRAYRLKGNKMWLVNASNFIWERCVIVSEDFLNSIRGRDDRCIGVVNNGVDNLYCYVRKEDVEYVFVAVCIFPSERFYAKYRLLKVLPLTFNKLSLLLNTEYRIQQRRDEKFSEIKGHVLYVNKATRLMHFIRNKMTPITNLIAYHKSKKSMSVEVKQRMSREIDKIYRVADSDLHEILSYANYLLDDSNNPFAENVVSEVGFQEIFIILSELAEHYLDISVKLDKGLQDVEMGKKVVHTNLIQFKILILDWIENMRKYGTSYYDILMSIEKEQLVIHFENDYAGDSEHLRVLINNLNSRAKDAILEGKKMGHGIFIIKSIAKQFDIEVVAQNKQDQNHKHILCLDFKLPIYERKENSNI